MSEEVTGHDAVVKMLENNADSTTYEKQPGKITYKLNQAHVDAYYAENGVPKELTKKFYDLTRDLVNGAMVFSGKKLIERIEEGCCPEDPGSNRVIVRMRTPLGTLSNASRGTRSGNHPKTKEPIITYFSVKGSLDMKSAIDADLRSSMQADVKTAIENLSKSKAA